MVAVLLFSAHSMHVGLEQRRRGEVDPKKEYEWQNLMLPGAQQSKGCGHFGDYTGDLQEGTSKAEECLYPHLAKVQVPWTPALTSTGPTRGPAD